MLMSMIKNLRYTHVCSSKYNREDSQIKRLSGIHADKTSEIHSPPPPPPLPSEETQAAKTDNHVKMCKIYLKTVIRAALK